MVVRQPLVDLVDDGKAAARAHRRQHLLHLRAGHRGAGRIRRRGDDHAARALAPALLDVLRRQLVALGRAGRHQRRLAAERRDEMAVAGIAGIGHQHFVAFADQRGACQQQAGRGAGGDDDAARVDLDTVRAGVVRRDRLAQRRQAERVGVLGGAGADRVDRRLLHQFGGGEVRLADAHADHVDAGARQRAGRLDHLHHVERLDRMHALRHLLRARRLHGKMVRWGSRHAGPSPLLGQFASLYESTRTGLGRYAATPTVSAAT